jgi:hypothetical protein
MLLTKYQITEIILGTVLFPMLYFLYLYFSKINIVYWDITWCTLVIFIILIFKNFYINFNILQAQNLSSSNIGQYGIY